MSISRSVGMSLLSVVAFSQCPYASSADPAAANPQEPYKKISFSGYLYRMGEKFDCYFTIETEHLHDNTLPVLPGELVDDREDIDSIQSLIEALPKISPGITVFRAADNQAVIHIMQNPLVGDKQYVLSKVLDFSFSGDALAFANSLGKRLEGQLRSRQEFTNVNNFDDYTTYLHVATKAATVRQILTNYLPLSSYSRILWNTETLTWHGKRETWVQFYGPEGARQDYSYMGPDAAEHFENGKVAYLFAPGSPLLRLMTVHFIDTHLSRNQPSQVRWAMLYLGKQEEEQGVPVLLKYLDYQYTNSPLPEEAFPALKALIRIGDASANSAVATLGGEKSDLRLQLLCRVIIGVHGLPEGRKFIEADLLQYQDTAMKKRVRAALATVEAQMDVARAPAVGVQPAAAHGS